MDIFVTLLFWSLAIFFLYGAWNNFQARGNVRQMYRNWGYPDGFHLVTASLEFIAAILLAIQSLRIFGAVLASIVMIAAIATLVRAGVRKPIVTPAIVLAFSSLGIAIA